MQFGPITLLESHFLTVPKEITLHRSWKQRLFSWPWRPWLKTETTTINVPDPNMIQIKPGIWLGHPATIAELRKILEKERNQ